jgi:curved DNA-binding protein CbpA
LCREAISIQEVKKTCRAQALKWHPGNNPDNWANQPFIEISHAYHNVRDASNDAHHLAHPCGPFPQQPLRLEKGRAADGFASDDAIRLLRSVFQEGRAVEGPPMSCIYYHEEPKYVKSPASGPAEGAERYVKDEFIKCGVIDTAKATQIQGIRNCFKWPNGHSLCSQFVPRIFQFGPFLRMELSASASGRQP